MNFGSHDETTHPMSDLFDFRPKSKDYAVMGNPVSHSRSPAIHALFGAQLGIDLHYTRIQVDPGGFGQAVSHFTAHGGAGLNVTVPFKVEAWELCRRSGNRLSDRAREAESVNTLSFPGDGAVQGDNTDGIGIVRDIEENLAVPLRGRRILVVGAGGAVRGVLGPVLARDPVSVHIVNRTASRAVAMAGRYANPGESEVTGGALDSAVGPYDLVINGTAASLGEELPAIGPGCVGPGTVAYDMMYGTEPTRFMKWALDQGAARASDGLGMLVEQAAESFFVWHGARPSTAPVISHLRKN